MTEVDRVYQGLADHLDCMPAGFPATPSGIELRILRRLFTPEEAAIAQLLSFKPESPEHIAARSGKDPAELAPRLEDMSRRGLIFRIRKGLEVRYMSAQFIIGIWEYHVNDLDPELIRDINEYLPYFFERSYRNKTPQLRTIPIHKALSAEQSVMPYDAAAQIIEEQDEIVVAPCICRREHRISGSGCDAPLETCLVFGVAAQYYEENGLGRRIDREEALEILREAERVGLVLQPSNARKVVNICVCCGCCCQILKNLKKLPEPARYVASNYRAAIDAALCSGCGICNERCQMDAIDLGIERAQVRADRCIGCGLCVPTCPEDDVRLEMKPAEECLTPPSHMMETFKKIAVERLKGRGNGKADGPDA